jgi:hypothetical protein
VPPEVTAKLIAIGTEFIGNRRKKHLHRHRRAPTFKFAGRNISRFSFGSNQTRAASWFVHLKATASHRPLESRRTLVLIGDVSLDLPSP